MKRLPLLLLLVLVSPAKGEDARLYLAATSSPGFTMMAQGIARSLSCLHPDFVMRLAWAIHEARENGMPHAGVFSACRPPVFGVGGFANKFDSLHAYGLAVDMAGIGSPGSETARLFHQIARRNGIACIYGPYNRAEWNHCQATRLARVRKGIELRETITAEGPSDLERLWKVADSLILKLGEPEPEESKAAVVAKPKKKRTLLAKKKGKKKILAKVKKKRLAKLKRKKHNGTLIARSAWTRGARSAPR